MTDVDSFNNLFVDETTFLANALIPKGSYSLLYKSFFICYLSFPFLKMCHPENEIYYLTINQLIKIDDSSTIQENIMVYSHDFTYRQYLHIVHLEKNVHLGNFINQFNVPLSFQDLKNIDAVLFTKQFFSFKHFLYHLFMTSLTLHKK